jgi:hypothetical protein
MATEGVAQFELDGHHCAPTEMVGLQGKRLQGRGRTFSWRNVD